MKRFPVCLLIFFLEAVPALPANNFEAVPPGNWAKVETLTPGAEISVKMISGDRMEGSFAGLDNGTLYIKIGGQDRNYPKKDVIEIRLLEIEDSNLNGTLWGFGIGGATLGTFVGLGVSELGWTSRGESVAITAVAIGIGGGIGALIGYAMDRTKKGSKLIYRAS